VIKPTVLRKGDTIGVISPSSPSFKRSEVLRGKETLQHWGYRVELSKNLNISKGFTAGSDKQRAADFNDMFARKDINAVFVTQGGYGSARMLRYIDFDLVRNNPKIFIGFSDITSLHAAIHKYTGLVTFHGPGMSRYNPEDLSEYTQKSLFKALTSPEPIGAITLADEKKWVETIYPGQCEGPLIGGNLTLLCATLGTPYEIDTKGKILFIEEVESEPWIIDHMLTHLNNAGKLEQAAGIVIGECVECAPNTHNPGYYVDKSLEDVLYDIIEPLRIPSIFGLPIGHSKDLATLPIGVQARLDAAGKNFAVIESCLED
jgi:muramoyltetrapeptide carboxypeptidase